MTIMTPRHQAEWVEFHERQRREEQAIVRRSFIELIVNRGITPLESSSRPRLPNTGWAGWPKPL